MNLIKKYKRYILIITTITLLTFSIIFNIWLIYELELLSAYDDETKLNLEESKEKIELILEENQAVRKNLVTTNLYYCYNETYRLARDYSKKFAEMADKCKEIPEEKIYSVLYDFKELKYLHNDFYGSYFVKKDDCLLSCSEIKGFDPYGIYNDSYFIIYYFYNADAAKNELASCTFYKSMGSNVYFATVMSSAWELDLERYAELLDKIDSPN